jgi:four helix bundle protein
MVMPCEKFEAWKVTHELALAVYRATEKWPKSEQYELTGQTRRAALCAPTNIAEGAAKRGTRELRRYVDIALGSLSELSYLLRFSKDCGILDLSLLGSVEKSRRDVDLATLRLPGAGRITMNGRPPIGLPPPFDRRFIFRLDLPPFPLLPPLCRPPSRYRPLSVPRILNSVRAARRAGLGESFNA